MKTKFYCSPSSKCWWWHEGTSQGITEAPGNMVRELWLHKNRCFYSTWKELPSRWSQRRWHPSHNVFRIHPLSTMNVFMGCQSNSSNGCWGISVWKQKRWRTHQPTVCDYHSWLPVRQIMLNPEFCASFFWTSIFILVFTNSFQMDYLHALVSRRWLKHAGRPAKMETFPDRKTKQFNFNYMEYCSMCAGMRRDCKRSG